MPRMARIALPNFPHHLVQRGHDRQDIFYSQADRMAYLETLIEFREQLQLRLYGYCLMTNHVHLIVDPGDLPDNLGRLMKRLAGRHTRRINRIWKRSGTLWGGRFHSSLIETDRYLLTCLRYVDRNPVRAGMVAAPEQFVWSSYRAKIGLTDCDWLDEDPCTQALATDRVRRQERYRDFVAQGDDELELKLIRGALQRCQLTASESFVKSVEEKVGREISRREPGRPFVPGNENGR